MAQIDPPFLLPFGDAGMVAHPNRWRAMPGELVLVENVILENDLLQADPASAYYHFQTGGATENILEPLFISQTVSGGDVGVGVAAYLQATTAGVTVGATSVATGSTAPTATWVVALTAGVPVGSTHAVTLTREAGTGGITAISDSKGHTYTKLIESPADLNGMRAGVWVAVLTTALVAADTLTLTVTDGTADWNILGVGYTGLVNPTIPVATITGSAASIGSFSGSQTRVHHYPLFGIEAVGVTNPVTTITNTGGWTVAATTTTAVHASWQLSRSVLSINPIIGQIEWESQSNTRLDAPTLAFSGTVSVTRGSRTVTGVGTVFTSQLRVGDRIIIAGEVEIIANIASTTVLTTIDPWEATVSGAVYRRSSGPTMVTAFLWPTAPDTAIFQIAKENPRGNQGGLQGNLYDTQLYIGTNAARRAVKFVRGGNNPVASLIPQQTLFVFTGNDPVLYLSGDANAMAVITTPPVDWGAAVNAYTQPVGGIIHQDALVGFGNLNDPHRAYFSTTDDQRIFIGSNAIQMRIDSAIGQRLFAAAHYQGVLFFFKYPTGIFYLDDTPVDRFQWGFRTRSVALGCAPSPHAVLEVDDDVLFCAPDGHFHLLSAVNTLGGTRDSDLTRLLGLQQWTHDVVAIGSLEQMVSVYDYSNKTAWFGFRSVEQAAAGLPDNDVGIRFDFSRYRSDGFVRFTITRTWRPNSLALKRRGFIGQAAVIIGEDGQAQFINPLVYGSRTDRDWIGDVDVTRGIPITAHTPELDLATADPKLRHTRKRFVALEAVFQQATNPTQAITVDLWLDGIHRQTLTYEQSLVRRIEKTLTCGDGYTFQARVTTDGSVVGDPGLLGLILHWAATSTGHSRPS